MKIAVSPFQTCLKLYLGSIQTPVRVLLHRANKALPAGQPRLTEEIFESLKTDPDSPHLTEAVVPALSAAFAQDMTFKLVDTSNGVASIKPKFDEEERRKFLLAAQSAIIFRDRPKDLLENSITEEWRKTNPPGMENKKSFAEMVEETWRQKGRMVALFSKLAKEWSPNDQKLGKCKTHEMMVDLVGKDKIPSREVFLKNFLRRERILREGTSPHITNLITAFNLTLEQELKLWRIASGHEPDVQRLNSLAETVCRNGDYESRKILYKELHREAGISTKRISEFLNIDREIYWQWRKGGRIESSETAQKLVDLLLPPSFLPEDKSTETKGLRKKILKAIALRKTSADISEIINVVQKSDHPFRTLLNSLFGQEGKTGISYSELAQKIGKTEGSLRNAVFHGRKFNYKTAKKIVEIAKIHKKYHEDIIEILTCCPSPEKIEKMIYEGKISFSEAALLLHERTGENFTQYSSETGVAKRALKNIEHDIPVLAQNAKKFAFYYFEENTDSYFRFICYACKKETMTPQEIIKKLRQNQIEPLVAFKYMLMFGGKTLTQIGSEIGASDKILSTHIKYSTLPETVAKKLEEVTGMPKEYFICFGSKRVRTFPIENAMSEPLAIPA